VGAPPPWLRRSIALAAIADPLAEAGLSIFAISTFDTDYVLVKATDLLAAIGTLQRAEHQVRR
jgi:uncharacterized protein